MLEILEGVVVLGGYQTESPARLRSSQLADKTRQEDYIIPASLAD